MKGIILGLIVAWLIGLTLLVRDNRQAIACGTGHWYTSVGQPEKASYWYQQCGLEP